MKASEHRASCLFECPSPPLILLSMRKQTLEEKRVLCFFLRELSTFRPSACHLNGYTWWKTEPQASAQCVGANALWNTVSRAEGSLGKCERKTSYLEELWSENKHLSVGHVWIPSINVKCLQKTWTTEISSPNASGTDMECVCQSICSFFPWSFALLEPSHNPHHLLLVTPFYIFLFLQVSRLHH